MQSTRYIAGKLNGKNTLHVVSDESGKQYNCYKDQPYNNFFTTKYKLDTKTHTYIENNESTDDEQLYTLCNLDITPDEALKRVKDLIGADFDTQYKDYNNKMLEEAAHNAYKDIFSNNIIPFGTDKTDIKNLDKFLENMFKHWIDFLYDEARKNKLYNDPDKEHGNRKLKNIEEIKAMVSSDKPYGNNVPYNDYVDDYMKYNKSNFDMITYDAFLQYLHNEYGRENTLTGDIVYDALSEYYKQEHNFNKYVKNIQKNILLIIFNKYFEMKTMYDLYNRDPQLKDPNILIYIILCNIFHTSNFAKICTTLFDNNQNGQYLYTILYEAHPREIKDYNMLKDNTAWKNNIIKYILYIIFDDIYNKYNLKNDGNYIDIDNIFADCAISNNIEKINMCIETRLKEKKIEEKNIKDILSYTKTYENKHDAIKLILNNIIIKFLNDRQIYTIYELLTNTRYDVTNILTMLATPAISAELKDENDNITKNNAYIKLLSFLSSGKSIFDNTQYKIADKIKEIIKKCTFDYRAENKHNITFHNCLQEIGINTITQLDKIQKVPLVRLLNRILGVIKPSSESSGGSSNRLSKLYISAKNDYYLL